MIIRSYPKVNICLKITGFLGDYCEIASRFMLLKSANLYDTIEISQSENFKIEGNFDCKMSDNTIFRAKEALKAFLESKSDLKDSSQDSTNCTESWQSTIKSLDNFHIKVNKKIPAFAGLGGGSSNAASYILAMNEILELNLTPKDLAQIAKRVGADVGFFVSGFSSANVFGVGENVEFFNEKALELEIVTPHIQCSTKAVYDEYRSIKAKELKANKEAQFFSDKRTLLKLDSATLMQKYSVNFLNDLYAPACKIYPQLAEFAKDGYFFSGSGSSFFRIKANRTK